MLLMCVQESESRCDTSMCVCNSEDLTRTVCFADSMAMIRPTATHLLRKQQCRAYSADITCQPSLIANMLLVISLMTAQILNTWLNCFTSKQVF